MPAPLERKGLNDPDLIYRLLHIDTSDRGLPQRWCSPRMVFLWNVVVKLARGRILDVGSADDPLELGGRVTHFDYDDWSEYYDWKGQLFIQGDAHQLSSVFPPGTFDTVLLGDVLEHVQRPQEVLAEACDVSSRLVAATVFEEWRYPEPGYHPDLAYPMGMEEVRKSGHESITSAQLASNPSWKSGGDLPHLFHLWQFDHDLMRAVVDFACTRGQMDLAVFAIAAEPVPHGDHTVRNWLILLERLPDAVAGV